MAVCRFGLSTLVLVIMGSANFFFFAMSPGLAQAEKQEAISVSPITKPQGSSTNSLKSGEPPARRAEEAQPSHPVHKPPGRFSWQGCSDEKLGVRFLCDPDWGLQEKGETLLIVISEEPAVTMTIAQVKTGVRYLEQLDRGKLSTLGEYADGFTVEDAVVDGRKSLRVKAFSKEFPEMRLLDYYFMKDDHVYGLLFSVDPKDYWEEYKFVINRVIESFRFTPVPVK